MDEQLPEQGSQVELALSKEGLTAAAQDEAFQFALDALGNLQIIVQRLREKDESVQALLAMDRLGMKIGEGPRIYTDAYIEALQKAIELAARGMTGEARANPEQEQSQGTALDAPLSQVEMAIRKEQILAQARGDAFQFAFKLKGDLPAVRDELRRAQPLAQAATRDAALRTDDTLYQVEYVDALQEVVELIARLTGPESKQ